MISKTDATKFSMGTAFVLAVMKATTGIMTGSLAVFASAVDSLLDILASFINFVALKMSEEPPDADHPFGHGKFESLASYLQSIIIMGSGIFILWQAYRKIVDNTPVESFGAGMIVMVISIIATLFLTLFLRNMAKKTGSTVLQADALHYSIDLLTNAGVLSALIIVKFTGWHIIDPILSIIVAVYIIREAFKLHKEVARDLLDSRLPDEQVEKIKEILDRFDPYHQEYHKLRTRKAGPKCFVDLHLVMCKHLSLEQAHDIATVIERTLKKEIPELDIVTHAEPCEQRCPGKQMCEHSNIHANIEALKKDLNK